MNTIECRECHEQVRRGEAVIRSDFATGRQRGYHRACYTVKRAVDGISVRVVAREEFGGTLSERLERVGR